MMTLPRCYIASPLGFNEAGRVYYAEHYLPALSDVVEAVDPWAQLEDGVVPAAAKAGELRKLWLEVGQKNLELIRSSELLVAWLDGQELDSGTATEIGYAAALGLPCFGLRSDWRQAGETEMSCNLQVESTIYGSGGEIVSSLAELVEAVSNWKLKSTN